MASIAREPNGRRRIQFMAVDGSRKTIRLGKVSQRAAEAVKVHVERLVTVSITGAPIEDETARWVANLEPSLAKRLAAVGLIRPVESKGVVTLGAFIDEYISRRAPGMKPATLVVWGQTRRYLVQHFGEDRDITTITPGCAQEWRESLTHAGLAEATIRKRSGFAKQFFTHAVRKRLLPANPFAELKSAARGNPDKFHFVSTEESLRIMDTCPSIEWRLIFSLASWGGNPRSKRTGPTEMGGRRLGAGTDSHYEPEDRTSRRRRIPPDSYLPQVLLHLEAAFDAAPEGAELLFSRRSGVNLRTGLLRILGRAGVTPWPKLFVNLRATRATELRAQFPAHVCNAWIGHSEAIANEHYVRVTDEDFARAVGTPSGCGQVPPQKAAQNPAQQAHANGGKGLQGDPPAHEETPVLPGFAVSCDPIRTYKVEDRGLEPLTS
jgi:hypothetical protein